MSLSSRFRKARIAAGLSQTELAAIASVDQTTISAIERGTSKQPRLIGAFANALGVSASWLQYGTDLGNFESSLNQKEKALINLYRRLNVADKRSLIRVAKGLVIQQENED